MSNSYSVLKRVSGVCKWKAREFSGEQNAIKLRNMASRVFRSRRKAVPRGNHGSLQGILMSRDVWDLDVCMEMVFVKFRGCALNVRMCHVDFVAVIHTLYGRTFSCVR